MCQKRVEQGRNKSGNPIVLIPLSSLSWFHIQRQPLGTMANGSRSIEGPFYHHLAAGASTLWAVDSSPGPAWTSPDCCSYLVTITVS